MLDFLLSTTAKAIETYFYYTTTCESAQEAFLELISYWYSLVTTVCVSALVSGIIMIAWYFKPAGNQPVQSVDENLVEIRKPIRFRNNFKTDRETVISRKYSENEITTDRNGTLCNTAGKHLRMRVHKKIARIF